VAVAENGRGGEVRQLGVFENRPDILSRMVARLGKSGRRFSAMKPVLAGMDFIAC